VTWSEAIPNLLIGLREGLEAGLVVTILLAALRKTEVDGKRVSSAGIWLGVLGAVMLAGSFAAVLTFSTDALPVRWQEGTAGVLSVLAVVLVTAMIFWMRRTAATLSGDLRGKVESAVAFGAGALALTAFLAVGREGLETTLFLWTAARAAGDTAAPLAGAAIGLAAAVALCWLLFRRAIRLNLGTFFSRTAIALIVIAAGVLCYGLGDLQDAGLLPGRAWVAFDVSSRIDANSWWASIVTGITELSPRMTVLQVAAWLAYLAVVIPAFAWAGRTVGRASAARASVARASAAGAVPAPVPADETGRWQDRGVALVTRRPWITAGVLVVVPAAAAGLTIIALPASDASATTVTVSASGCAPGWSSARTGSQTFQVRNTSAMAGEVNLVNAAGAIVAEIETIGPATTAPLSATLAAGSYTFKCYLSGKPATSSATVQAAGRTLAAAPAAIRPVTVADLQPAARAYRSYVAPQLRTMVRQVDRLRADLRHPNLAATRRDWLAAQLTWDRIGAAYDSFGDLGDAIDGLPEGLPGGVRDKDFTGLHRLEYGLWHGQRAAGLEPIARRLATDVTTLRGKLTQLTIDPTDLPLRAHEILEDALRDRLTGMADEGSGAAYPETYADLQGTRVVLGELAPLIAARAPDLMPTVTAQLSTLQTALLSTRSLGQWRSLADTPLAARQHVDAAIGAALETLSRVPDLLEVPPHA
jgi:high-affinity iron transporter